MTEHIESVIIQVCKESKLGIHPKLRWSSFSLTFLIKFTSSCIVDIYMDLKGNAQFIFLCNPQKSGASRVWIIFLQITQKVLTKNVFHWLELIAEILNFLQIFSVRKTTT